MKGGIGKLLVLFVAGLMVASAAGCTSASSDGEKTADREPYKIGAILSLTGTYAALGEAEKKAIDLEVERINEAGGVNGREIEVIVVDDGTDEARAQAAASRLIEQDEVIAIIGASGTGQTMATRGELQRSGVPQVSLAGGTVVTGEFDPLVFQTPWSNTLVVPFVLDTIKQAGHTKIALLSDSGGYGKDGRDVVLTEAEKSGIEVVSDQTFNPGDADVSAQLTKVKSSDAQALLLWTAGKEAALAVKSADELGLGLPMFGASGQAKMEFIEGAGEAGEGFVFGTGASLVPENWGEGTPEFAAVSEFAERYEAAYAEAPDIFAGHAFDAMSIIADALERAGDDPDPGELRDAIEATSGLAGFGGSFTFSATDHNGLTKDDLALYKVEKGTWVPVK